MKIHRVALAAVTVFGLLAADGPLASATIPLPGRTGSSGDEVLVFPAEETDFEWTLEALHAAAEAEGPDRDALNGRRGSPATETVQEVLSEPVAPSADAAVYAAAIPTVGRLYFTHNGKAETCTAASVTTATNSSVLTAGHCLYRDGVASMNIVYVPGQNGASEPFGKWSASTFLVTHEWADQKDPVANQAVVNFKARSDGMSLTDVVGSYGLSIGEEAAQRNVSVVGYPSNPGTVPHTCKGTSHRPTPVGFTAIADCESDRPSSGAPFLRGGYIFAVLTLYTGSDSAGPLLNEHTRNLFAQLQDLSFTAGTYTISTKADSNLLLGTTSTNDVTIVTAAGGSPATSWMIYPDYTRNAMLVLSAQNKRSLSGKLEKPENSEATVQSLNDVDEQFWVPTPVDPTHGSGYVLANYENPGQVLQYRCANCAVTVTEYDPGNTKQLWGLKRTAALDLPDASLENRTVTIRPNNSRTLALDSSGLEVKLRSAGDFSRESFQIARVGPAFSFRNVLTGRNLSGYGGTVTARDDGKDIFWDVRPGPAGTFTLAPLHSHQSLAVAEKPTDGSPVFLQDGAQVFDLVDVGGPLERLATYTISTNDGTGLVATSPGTLGSAITLGNPGNSRSVWRAHWIMESGSYTFEATPGRNMAWDSSKGNRVVLWDGSYTDQHWIPRQTPHGTVLVNMKDPIVALQHNGQTGATNGSELTVNPFAERPNQYWNLTKRM